MWKSFLIVLIVACSSLTSGFLLQDEGFLMYFNKAVISVQAPDLTQKPIRLEFTNTSSVVEYSVSTKSATERQVDLTFKQNAGESSPDITVREFSMSLLLVEAGGYFNLKNTTAKLDGTVKAAEGSSRIPFGNPTEIFRMISEIALEAPKDRSFHCSQFGRLYPDFNARVGNYTPSVEFVKLQVQAFTNGTASAKPEFQKSWDCVGFFTIGIWSGLFVASILIGIIIMGLAMIMDVKTNDRFDDPKGKAISFGGTE